VGFKEKEDEKKTETKRDMSFKNQT